MATILIVGSDQGVLKRWSDMARLSGHDFSILSEAQLLDGSPQEARVCVYDLGSRGGADARTLVAAVNTLPETLFVALSARPDPREGLRLLRAGVRGYCNRLASAKVIVALLSTVEGGEIWAGKQVTDYLLSVALAKEQPGGIAATGLFAQLTAREAEIAQQVAAGRSNKVIAAENHITERTVKAHLNNIFRKTGIRNRVQLALAVSQIEEDQRKLSSG